MSHTLRDGSGGTQSPSANYRPAARTDWMALSVAILAPILIVHFCIVRPASQQLAQMRGQMASLEATVHELRAKAPAAEGAATLLTSLTEQEALAERASATLDRVTALQVRLAQQTAALSESTEALDQIATVQNRIDEQGRLLGEATSALAAFSDLPAKIENAIDRAGRAAPTVARLERLGDRLAESSQMTDAALSDIDLALDTQREVVLGAASLAAASETLEGLLQLESRLNAPLMAVAAAHERLDELMGLKSAVLSQTENLPEAFDTLELMVTLQQDYRRASGVFRTLQRLLADLVMLEPSISRVASAVQPMLERTALSRLGGEELRLVLQELRDRHAEAVRDLELAEQNPAPSRAERIAARPESR